MNLRIRSLAAAVLLAGCASAPAGGPAASPGVTLAYQATAPETLTYSFNDSSAFTISGGAIGDIRVSATSVGTVEAAVTPKETGLEMRMRVTDLEASASNSAMGATLNATESDVTGEAVVTVSPRGEHNIAQLPTISRTAQQTGVGAAFFRRFVVRLPAEPVRVGSTWTDTINAVEESAGIRSSVTDIVTSTWVRDTTVNGRTLNVIAHSTQRTLDVSGNSDGVQISQKLSGTATGETLWDPERHVVAERYESMDLSGTFDLPAMGLSGLPVSAKGSARITLR